SYSTWLLFLLTSFPPHTTIFPYTTLFRSRHQKIGDKWIICPATEVEQGAQAEHVEQELYKKFDIGNRHFTMKAQSSKPVEDDKNQQNGSKSAVRKRQIAKSKGQGGG